MATAPGTEPAIELLKADAYAQYLLHDAREIAYVLRQLAARRSLTTGYFGSTRDFMLTTVLSVSADNQWVYIDVGSDDAVTQGAVKSDRLQCATQIDNIKVQFALHTLSHATHEDSPAIRAAIPDSLLRLQRREHFRMQAPTAEPIVCAIPQPDGSSVTTRVIDISGGGIALMLPTGYEPQQGDVLENCRLNLPETPVTVKLEVRNLFRIRTRTGQDLLRAGCQLLNPSPAVTNNIQRYIFRVERERRQHT
ncbi:MAG: flagellar brake protein [Candidatus Dactylopiibacterium sp.]|nr:flagellar brake protein [Candidatus Dactylopiibacterium sp.]